MGTTDEVLHTLHKTRLSEWKAIRDAMPARFNNVLAAAAKLLEPKAQEVSLPGTTIKNKEDLRAWLALVEEEILEKLEHGPVIV